MPHRNGREEGFVLASGMARWVKYVAKYSQRIINIYAAVNYGDERWASAINMRSSKYANANANRPQIKY